ncbi:methylenetetrahydrofolate dehydrogenase (NADP+)/methenyltetrahydrofolate cyclohydrolase [Orenia metallireducens]|jgi:methylenetetrahydrofolate dehydrogenase (NADP+)/methenyltetrahydrofolate cyclohydrolase|uniref:Bifunctional protein FolD n=1 Tax=Orenia metallireducens TaxID=1413210 RepID=A0A285HLT0_9FIRM|nr:bifunctional methylenetetrahydrofolate dehydrogenase/methenyltetrahydrofolate cyclohydrolase FolD [Orenia metallireducens]PRX26928.1 methylenetetrahydrofolate dehydrogenase (NADP+)/methenyltetrahydrofolate cyclohydrolase [Orenia metallireducens]SNY36682.1 methylenetetrahydrofolate dehydrogenase (NADP+) / methenyltetrahydrofolate cyclohydrolase [Orenia metallireducens]
MSQTKILDGRKVAKELEAEIGQVVENLTKQGITPGLTVILVGDNPASEIYVSYKEKACKRVGINSNLIKLPAEINEEELLGEVERLNQDDSVDGILVQLPLPEHIDEEKVINTIRADKDVDGFHPINIGKLMINGSGLHSCTPRGIMEILHRYEIEVEGKNAVIIGRSNIVGKPMAQMLLQENATVTICHSRTKDLKEHTLKADILVAAVGRAEFVTADMVKKGAVIIDVGINRTENGLLGDVEFKGVKEKAAAITPVPGGVGPMTIATLLKNTLKACQERRG